MVGFSMEPVTVHLTFAIFSLPRLWATCWGYVILHHQANSDSDIGSAGSDSSNRYAVLQDDEEEEVSDATTDILPIEEIPESIQEGAVLIQPDSNETPDNIQVEVAEPVVEGGNTPQEEDPQPVGIVSFKDADFLKVEPD